MKASFIKTLALASGFACLTAFAVGPAMAGDKDIAQPGKTRAEVRAEYLQAVREGTLPNTTEMDETSYRALTARGSPIKEGTAIAQTGKTRAEVRAEYLQAVREGTLPNTTEMDETSYRAMTARGPAIKDGKALAQATEPGARPAGSSLSATAPSTSPLSREAVRADTIEWLRLHRGDLQMGAD